MAPISTSGPDSQKLVNEVANPGHAYDLSRLGSRILRQSVVVQLCKAVLNLGFPSEDFLSKPVLLVEEDNHRDGAQPSATLLKRLGEALWSMLSFPVLTL